MGYRVKVGREKLVAKLNKLAPEVVKASAPEKLKSAQETASAIASVAPYSSGEYYDSLEGGFQRDNTEAHNSLGRKASKDPDATGVYGKFYWRFLEFGIAPHINGGIFAGTENPGTAPQPHVFPTWRAMRPRVKRRIRAAVNTVVKKINSR